MITESESGNILYVDCRSNFGDIVFQTLNAPVGELEDERIVIVPKSQQPGSVWIKNYIEVNWLVPDMPDGKPDMIRLHEVEREMRRVLIFCGSYDNTPYRYRVENTDIRKDENLNAHYVNARLLFQTMNINQEI